MYVGLPTEEFSSEDHSSDSQHCNMVPSNVVERPGPIDNSDIIISGSDSSENDDLELKSFLEERRDYVLVPTEVWEKLYDWYDFLLFSKSNYYPRTILLFLVLLFLLASTGNCSLCQHALSPIYNFLWLFV